MVLICRSPLWVLGGYYNEKRRTWNRSYGIPRPKALDGLDDRAAVDEAIRIFFEEKLGFSRRDVTVLYHYQPGPQHVVPQNWCLYFQVVLPDVMGRLFARSNRTVLTK